MNTTDTDEWAWVAEAACKGYDPNMWFEPTVNDFETQAKNKIAKSICLSCPVRDMCLEYSLHFERYGIWGGLAANDREQIRRRKHIDIIVRRLI